uniref:Uncharacterized protein n=1 Tax=Arundo donax TaxID=35708 RepID=A0A0A8ZVI1_ARUDO
MPMEGAIFVSIFCHKKSQMLKLKRPERMRSKLSSKIMATIVSQVKMVK